MLEVYMYNLESPNISRVIAIGVFQSWTIGV
nr:MAG TPA: hypothetical protein [Myoviridae sp. cttWQ44]